MIQIIKAKDRHFSDFGWLKTYWLFSFSDYYDPENLSFGKLRVFNDDIVSPRSGFEPHYHNNMEIVTIVLEGSLIHKDNIGNSGQIRENDIQRMSAGSGIIHSEKNLDDKPVHFYQIWISTDKPDIKPSYEQKTFPISTLKNKLIEVVSGKEIKNVVKFNSDSTIFIGEFEKSKELSLDLNYNRKIFIYLKEGDLNINGTNLKSNDQARISLEKKLRLKFNKKTFFILINVPDS